MSHQLSPERSVDAITLANLILSMKSADPRVRLAHRLARKVLGIQREDELVTTHSLKTEQAGE